MVSEPGPHERNVGRASHAGMSKRLRCVVKHVKDQINLSRFL